jgi:succinyl-diaminopimelate desuccinylase
VCNKELFDEIEKLRAEMIDGLMELIRIPAVGPENGGDGESKKAEKLIQMLKEVGFDQIQLIDAEDSRVSAGKRPNIAAYIYGENVAKRLCIVTHMDVVPAGELALWTVTAPFEPVLKGNRVYGRGAEDNGQSLIASLFALKAIKRLGLRPSRTVVLVFVSDEEQGNRLGIQHLIEKGIFRKDDLILVPDGGSPDGSFIEVAEKSILWFRLRTIGRQVHASLPNKGLNAHRIGMRVALAIDNLMHDKYSFRDERFDFPESTFEITKKENNVEAVNIVPGEDIVYFDCRILPNYDLDEVISDITKVVVAYEKETGAKILIEVLQKQVGPETEDDSSEVALRLREALKDARRLNPVIGGLGGGTCAAFFRRAGFSAVVWSTVDEVAHQPNEYSIVDNMVNDAKIFAHLATG